ncbi:PucR family transcriptional regulator [Solirubrobacter soli]|uniref:PucR family transcriptional regulator n=1 Tax=Solirubrobacter soli TaxID=363832 RepID=UPI000419EE96|nr:PucR family transcriptional regulator [Solirubrobacter soli]
MQTATSALVLGDLVAQEDLGLTLLSGGAGALDREVAGAHSIDVEEPTRFLERHWVMLTAGMRLKGSVAAQKALIRELDEGGMAALGIGIDLVFKRVPPALLDEARERSFPVLAVPLDTAFRDIVGFINRSLLSSDLHTYQRLNAIQRHLVDALKEPRPREVMVERLARMLDAGVAVICDGRVDVASGTLPDDVIARVDEREFEHDGWHVVTAPIGDTGWLAVASRGRMLAARLARPAAQAAVPLLAATERLGDLARDQERAVRSALLDEALEGSRDTRALAARAASFGLDFTAPARVVVATVPRDGAAGDAIARAAGDAGVPHLVSARGELAIALVQGVVALTGLRAGIGRPVTTIGDVPRSYRDALLAVERVTEGQLAYEDFDLATLLLAEVPPEHIRPRVDELLAPLKANPPLLEALVEYFARDMDVNATAEAMHVHPNTLRYRLGRVEKLLGRSLRRPATIAELTLALQAPTG